MSFTTIRLTAAILAASVYWLSCPIPVRAEMPPTAYKHLQDSAPESLLIHVEEVSLRQSVTKEAKITSVKLKASVKKVNRTVTGLKRGEKITVTYEVTEHLTPWAGPSQVTVPDKSSDCPAYLERNDTGAGRYRPSAGGYTFRKLVGEKAP